ncbi:MAG: chaperone modulator CbpM [Legionellaceae bacterium]|nr:chaperone modulator CbpM [Legionellaceae bacterium]
MTKSTITVGVLVDEQSSISFVEVCEYCEVSEKELLEMLEHGLISSIDMPSEQLQFDREMLKRIESAYRLQEDLGLNAAGVVLALELMDELQELNQELEILKRHLNPKT